MKNNKQDSTFAVSRFGRDKRQRISSTEQVERRPRPQRDADNEGQRPMGHRSEFGAKRASYNPNFTADNRLHGSEGRGTRKPFERQERQDRQERSYGARRNYNSQERSFSGEESHSEQRFAPRSEQRFSPRSESRSEYGSQDRRQGGNKPAFKSQRGDATRGGFKPAGGGQKRSFRPKDDAQRSYPKYAAKQTGDIRLNKFLAQSGLCSRREADSFIQAGLVTVNGVIVTELGVKVKSSDEVKFNDSKVQGEKKVYLVLNKPKGYVTSLEDPHADKTVMDLIKGACAERVYPVGRLDKNSLGLLLFTNDGDITRQLTHPSHEKKKIYQVSLDKPLTRADMELMTEGITLEDGEIYADEVAYVSDSKTEIGIEIHSGRNRIVRRIFEHLGYTVLKLDRVYYAGITKKNLKRGQWRFLTHEEVDRLKSGRYE
ncbi:MAG: pseudouridine synthase [Alistipes sp.]|nr:pseudouridine synthase [Alistipes sp.]MBQ5914917.1 pseudouridine synthase [Alistipes sp.]